MQDMSLTAPEVWGPQMDIEPSALQAYFSEPLVSYDGVAMRASLVPGQQQDPSGNARRGPRVVPNLYAPIPNPTTGNQNPTTRT